VSIPYLSDAVTAKEKKFENDFYGAGRVDRQPEFLYMKELSPASSLAHKSIVMAKVHA
jgi:hypothetical protein